jgi:benzoyl-CoA reductase subunit BamC
MFKEPDSGLPLKCDMCESDPPLEEPVCVQVCRVDALTYEETEVEGPAEEEPSELEIGLDALINRYGPEKVLETMARKYEQE